MGLIETRDSCNRRLADKNANANYSARLMFINKFEHVMCNIT